MSSQAQIDSARRNGALSRGPKTAEGRRRSSMNALKHGLCASRNVLYSNEDTAAYAEIVAGYLLEFQPRTPSQLQLVEQLASCHWRIGRAVALDTAAHDHELERQALELAETDAELPETARLLCAARPLIPDMVQIHRHEHTLSNRYHRIHRQLTVLCKGNSVAAFTSPVFTPGLPDAEGGEK